MTPPRANEFWVDPQRRLTPYAYAWLRDVAAGQAGLIEASVFDIDDGGADGGEALLIDPDGGGA